ncbi:MAG: sxtJ [Gammaproteobacteria bacterium]|nr:sxtJ [Gammaproteobacteria bacterium]
MSAVIEKLNAKGYRKFGLTTGVILVVLFGLLIPWIFDLNYPKWPWIIGGTLGALALLMPVSLQPIYIGWMKFGNVMNWINTRLILGILFFGIFLPIGVFMRLLGKDSMHRKLDKTLPTYRVNSEHETKDNVERPY